MKMSITGYNIYVDILAGKASICHVPKMNAHICPDRMLKAKISSTKVVKCVGSKQLFE